MGIFSTREYLFNGKRNKNEIMTIKYRCEKYGRIGRNIFGHSNKKLNSMIIEKYLWLYGHCIIYENEILGKYNDGLVYAHGSPTKRDINGKPLEYEIVYEYQPPDFIDYPHRLDIRYDKMVVIYDTSDYEFKRSDALFMVSDLADLIETIRTQTFNQKTPLMAITGNVAKAQKLTKNIIDLATNHKLLIVDEDINNMVKSLNFDAPFNIDKLNAQLQIIENEILTNIGCDSNTPEMKKERLITDEISGNDEVLNYLLLDCLNARNKGNEDLKRVFGIENITKINEMIRPVYLDENNKENDKEKESDNNDRKS